LRCADRPSLYAAVAKHVKEPASYLEFGVFTGSSLREWIKLLRHPESTFDGFDSFEGLPENWGLFTRKEVFEVGKDGVPHFDDSRVRLHKGWFTDTVPPFLREFRPRPNLVLHLDADLYSSTIFALRQMRPYMQPGTILIFDEFFDREHELKALNEFLEDERIRVKCLAATRALTQAAFEIVALEMKRDATHETSRKQV
jgi:O-methyltransferase